MAKPSKPRTSLAELAGDIDRPDMTVASERESHRPPEPERPAASPPPSGSGGAGAALTFFVTPSDKKRLRTYCFEHDTTYHALAHKALSDYLVAHGLPALEPQAANRGPGGRKPKNGA